MLDRKKVNLRGYSYGRSKAISYGRALLVCKGGPYPFECRIENAELAFPVGEGDGEADG